MSLKAVSTTTRKVGDSIKVYDNATGKYHVDYAGVISKLTSKFVTVKNQYGDEQRFHRTTGFQVGYHWPYTTLLIAPETCKEMGE